LRAHLLWYLTLVVLPPRLELFKMGRPVPSQIFMTSSLVLVRSLCRVLIELGSAGSIYPALFAHYRLTLLFACLSSI
jgi:hypothetical protein